MVDNKSLMYEDFLQSIAKSVSALSMAFFLFEDHCQDTGAINYLT